VFLLIPNIQVVSFEAAQVALGRVRNVFLANLFDIEKPAVFFEARAALYP
jgi:hypothetical protein